jgi:hypothetical protein
MVGQRCHAMRSIRGHQGLITAHTQGTIEAEISNLGRNLIVVRWDTGLQMYMFPDEIEIDQPLEEWHGDTPLMHIPSSAKNVNRSGPRGGQEKIASVSDLELLSKE